MRTLGAVRDAAGFNHVAKQAEIDEVKTHWENLAFVFYEVRLNILPIVS
jgi:hypothetical protein